MAAALAGLGRRSACASWRLAALRAPSEVMCASCCIGETVFAPALWLSEPPAGLLFGALNAPVFAPPRRLEAGFAGRRSELPAVFPVEALFLSPPEKILRRQSVAFEGPHQFFCCDVANESAFRNRNQTMHQCGEKENPKLTPTQYCLKS